GVLLTHQFYHKKKFCQCAVTCDKAHCCVLCRLGTVARQAPPCTVGEAKLSFRRTTAVVRRFSPLGKVRNFRPQQTSGRKSFVARLPTVGTTACLSVACRQCPTLQHTLQPWQEFVCPLPAIFFPFPFPTVHR